MRLIADGVPIGVCGIAIVQRTCANLIIRSAFPILDPEYGRSACVQSNQYAGGCSACCGAVRIEIEAGVITGLIRGSSVFHITGCIAADDSLHAHGANHCRAGSDSKASAAGYG